SKTIQGSKALQITSYSRADLDLSAVETIKPFFKNKAFDILINAAAYTQVDKAETDQDTCYACNAEAIKELAELCKEKNALLIHFSTDFVFDGTQPQAYKEEDKSNPLQVYGKSKLIGETYNTDGITIRTSWVYAAEGKNFLNTIFRLASEREILNIVANQIGTPTFANDLAEVVLKFCLHPNTKTLKGIYHYSNEGVASWYDFAHAIVEYAQLNCKVLPIKDLDYPTPAARPHFSLLDKTKIKKTLQIEIPHWQSSLKKCIDIKLEK
ncbi:MAG: dTDP-4-dehydrorhamnose reductase, partial [Chitinophagales bacterium]|nr:dTDP-4-dehydrorhamnose reductase [Chitinophagales bacterium]